LDSIAVVGASFSGVPTAQEEDHDDAFVAFPTCSLQRQSVQELASI
jgi:hypothetical protein